MKLFKHGNTRVWYDESVVSEPEKRLFDIEFWQSLNAVVGSATGRGTTWFVQFDTMQAALRHYRRGGLFGKLVKDNYWFSSWEKTRSAAEFQLLLTLTEAGVNVPKPIAARAVKTGFTYQADLLSQRIPNAKDLVSILQDQALPVEMYHKIGQEIAKMHNAGVNHTDLNIHNILIDADEKVWIIDFDKCCQQAGSEWRRTNLDRLLRSFRKEQRKRAIHWQEDEFNHLLTGYK
ncbi:3-deoxy-D-manno-octulosonic acid kinase [Vibrio natriegens]|uniref:3-deoxy-D-manno-octulosonic acid kinase n=1 Tax=Vibrio natriegens TaxID=691 RepID=UPI001EFEC1C5|nr:3-deoxy-D-manno-octulosonic acid kinase [Vibrio natriegens]MCG9701177.1 3-deoxy-D-manno-octulosonic acid kinase [Vibrio natriegens]